MGWVQESRYDGKIIFINKKKPISKQKMAVFNNAMDHSVG